MNLKRRLRHDRILFNESSSVSSSEDILESEAEASQKGGEQEFGNQQDINPNAVRFGTVFYIGVGTGFSPPLPPNRACGSPAHGSPVDSFFIEVAAH